MTRNNKIEPSKKTRMNALIYSIKKNREIYIMLIPVVLYYVIFRYAPMFGNMIAFQNYKVTKGILGSDWVGFKHFIAFFNDIFFLRVLKNTLTISVSSLLFSFPMPIIFALLLNEVKNLKFKLMQ